MIGAARRISVRDLANSSAPHLSDELLSSWRQEGRLGAEGSEEGNKRIQLLFADRGTYRSSDLMVREQMLDMLRATILLMNRELASRIREVMIQMALRKRLLQGNAP